MASSRTTAQPAGAVGGAVVFPPVTIEATITWPGAVPAGRPSVRLGAPSLTPPDDEPTRSTGPSSASAAGGAPWQAVVPESVNVLPASGTNCQS